MDLERAEPVTEFTVSGLDRVMSEAGQPGRFNPFSGGETFEDAAGRFRLEGVEPGEVSLSFRSVGYLTEVVDEIIVVEGQPTRGVIVRMQPGGLVSGVVVDSEGLPVRGAQVVAVSRGQRNAGRQNRREGRNRRRNASQSGDGEESQELDEGRQEFSMMMGGGRGAAPGAPG